MDIQTLTGETKELDDMMKKRKVKIVCVQEIRGAELADWEQVQDVLLWFGWKEEWTKNDPEGCQDCSMCQIKKEEWRIYPELLTLSLRESKVTYCESPP